MIKIWIKRNLYVKLIDFTMEFMPNETGGMLLGYTSQEGDLVLSNIIGPGPKAVHLNNYFLPDGDYQQKKLTNLFNKSGGAVSYLGDWHSHPFNNSYVSQLDFKTLKEIAFCPTSGTQNPIILILGTDPLDIKCWMYSNDSKSEIEDVLIRIWD